MKYKDLLDQIGEFRRPTYDELLSTTEWYNKRDMIKSGDRYTCTDCNRGTHREMTEAEILVERARRQSEYENALTQWNELYGHMTEDDLNNIRNLSIRFRRPVNHVNNPHFPYYIQHDPPKQFEVHHRAYVKGKLPWDYPDDWLTTLCSECHHKVHFGDATNLQQQIKVYTSFTMKQELLAPSCTKCNGHGYIEAYKHVQSGICFDCWGYGKKWIE